MEYREELAAAAICNCDHEIIQQQYLNPHYTPACDCYSFTFITNSTKGQVQHIEDYSSFYTHPTESISNDGYQTSTSYNSVKCYLQRLWCQWLIKLKWFHFHHRKRDKAMQLFITTLV